MKKRRKIVMFAKYPVFFGLIILTAGLLSLPAQAVTLTFTLEGFAEPFAGINPMGLMGDGDRNTITDGTPFSATYVLNSNAVDFNGFGNLAMYTLDSAVVVLGGNTFFATDIPGQATVQFFEDSLFDETTIIFGGPIVLNGVSAQLPGSLTLPGDTFSLLDDGSPDPVPLLDPGTLNLLSPGFQASTAGWQYHTVGATVSTVPIPAAIWFLCSAIFSLIGVAGFRRASL